MRYQNIEKHVQLHEKVEIRYTVDGYDVDFISDDGSYVRENAWGETIKSALDGLDAKLANLSAKFWEK